MLIVPLCTHMRGFRLVFWLNFYSTSCNMLYIIHRVQIFLHPKILKASQGMPSKAFPLRISPPEDGRGRGGVSAPRSEFHRHPSYLWPWPVTGGDGRLSQPGRLGIGADPDPCWPSTQNAMYNRLIQTHSYIVLSCQKLCQGRGRMCWWKVPQRLSVRMQLKQMHLKMRIMNNHQMESRAWQLWQLQQLKPFWGILSQWRSVKCARIILVHRCQAVKKLLAKDTAPGWVGREMAQLQIVWTSLSAIYLNDHEDTS